MLSKVLLQQYVVEVPSGLRAAAVTVRFTEPAVYVPYRPRGLAGEVSESDPLGFPVRPSSSTTSWQRSTKNNWRTAFGSFRSSFSSSCTSRTR